MGDYKLALARHCHFLVGNGAAALCLGRQFGLGLQFVRGLEHGEAFVGIAVRRRLRHVVVVNDVRMLVIELLVVVATRVATVDMMRVRFLAALALVASISVVATIFVAQVLRPRPFFRRRSTVVAAALPSALASTTIAFSAFWLVVVSVAAVAS